MTPIGILDTLTSLIWTRRYWSSGTFSLLAPFTPTHARLLKKHNLVIKRDEGESAGLYEAAEIRYVHIRKNTEGMQEIEVQGKFLTGWLGKRIILHQLNTVDTTQNIIHRIVSENIINPSNPARKIPGLFFYPDDDVGGEPVEYCSEAYTNALLGIEAAAKAAKLGFRVLTDIRTGYHFFGIYKGRNLTIDSGNPHCIFSQEFDNIIEQEYTNSVENLKSTAYVGGEEPKPDNETGVLPERFVTEVGVDASGLERDEVFINATDITQVYKDADNNDVIRSDEEIIAALASRGAAELEHFAETLGFSSKINPHSNLKYKRDFDLGDRVTCINKDWGIRINVRITEITETYQQNMQELDITFGESLPALLDTIRHIAKG